MKLKGKVALITGGGTGIGTAIAERFVSEGARICITGRRQELLNKVACSLPAKGGCPGVAEGEAGRVGGPSHPPTRILDARCSMLDARCSMLDARCSNHPSN